MHIRECETFGEMGLIENELRNARASCLTDCLIVHIERVDFEANMRMLIPDQGIGALAEQPSARCQQKAQHPASRRYRLMKHRHLAASDPPAKCHDPNHEAR